MCGIVGVVDQAPINNQALLLAMRNTMQHRGPDDAGVWWAEDKQVGLAQQRLAIIDLSPGGHQPMADAASDLWLSFNGEIYNYQALRRELQARGHIFRTMSDSEVILEAYRAWGTDCVKHFNGMFAFGIYDRRARRLFLARDRAGEKPLFYRHAAGRFVFASELKALLADADCPRELDLTALDYYLAYGYVPGALCLLRGVHKLPQGHAATLDMQTDELRVWPYWQLPRPSQTVSASEAELVDELEALLLDSVRLRLVADVPVGVLLSGGVDSSLVTALAARVSAKPIKTFTVAFPGHGSYDEGPYARLVAAHFGTEHHELVAEEATVELLPELAAQYDEPIADSSMVPTYLVSRLIRQQATVALGGDGGDELFGGYWHHSFAQRQEQMRQYLPEWLRAQVSDATRRLLPLGVKGRNYLLGLGGDLPEGLARFNLYFDAAARRQLLNRALSARGLAPETYKAQLCLGFNTALQQATALDFMTYLVDDILVKVDRASMLTSLEVRAPWLDHRIIEFAFARVPDSLRATASARKVLPRRLAQRLLPAALDLKRKQGFSLPLARWFKGDWGGYIKAVLAEADQELFDHRQIRRLIKDNERGCANTHRLFALAMFELWRRHYRVRLPGASGA
jgi:asparagine synthase (glutamine-hydrolysing)